MLPRSLRLPLFLCLAALLPSMPSQAQVEYNTATGFDVSWTLDPRDFPELFDHGPGFGTTRVLTGMDFDADGNKEILFATDETLAPLGPDPGLLDVYLYENTGDDQYEHVWHYTHRDSTNSAPPITYGDLDEDGRPEIYLGIPTIDDVNKLFIFEADANGVFPDEPTTTYGYEREATADFRPSAFDIGDIDGDGQLELVTTSRTSLTPGVTGGREAVIISPDGQIDAFATFTIEHELGNELLAGGTIYDTEIVDFDGDGMMEVWVNTWDCLSMTIVEATGADTYALATDINKVYEPCSSAVDHGGLESMTFHDVDGDGNLEVVYVSTEGDLIIGTSTEDVSTYTDSSFHIVGRFAPGITQSSGDANRGGDAGDLDGDALLDIVANSGYDEELWWMEYSGEGDITDSTSYSWMRIAWVAVDTSDGRFYPLQIADDLDKDGFNEVVVTNLRATDEGQPIIIVFETNAQLVSAEDEAGANGLALRTVSPNPFRTSATISYETKAAGPVRLEVFDVRGKRVATLVDRVLPSGNHEATIQASGLPSGVYLVRLTADGTALTSKAVLVR